MKISHPSNLLISLVICLALFACSEVGQKPREQEPLLKNNLLRVGTVYGRQTYFIGANGPEGFEYELAKGFAKFLGAELEILAFISFEELNHQLQQGKLDIIATGNGSNELSTNQNWGPTYQTVSHELVYLQGQPRPRSVDDLTAPIVVVGGTSHVTSLRNFAQESVISIEEISDRDSEELLVAVANGDVHYTIADSNELSIVRRRYPELSIGFTLYESLPVAWQLANKNDDLLQSLLFEYVASIRANGVMAQLEDKYFGHVREFNFVDTKVFIQSATSQLPTFAEWFKAASDKLDWRLLAAMSYQESHWDPKAVSRTGVRGLMMLTLDTAKDWGVTSRLDPQQSISGGARYFASLIQRIPARIKSPDRLWMALAAYNIGLGHLEDARILTQRQGGDPDIWIDVKQRLPQLQQKRYYSNTRYGYARGQEALDYVENIRRYYDTLVWMDENTSL